MLECEAVMVLCFSRFVLACYGWPVQSTSREPAPHTQVAARYGVVKVADFGLSRVTTLLRTGLGHTSFAGSRNLQQSFNEVRRRAQ